MADINSVITKIQAAMDEASAVAGTPTQAQQIADLQAQLATANADKATLQGKITAALADMDAADTGDAAEDAARAAARAKLTA